jgi:hypothetical protein
MSTRLQPGGPDRIHGHGVPACALLHREARQALDDRGEQLGHLLDRVGARGAGQSREGPPRFAPEESGGGGRGGEGRRARRPVHAHCAPKEKGEPGVPDSPVTSSSPARTRTSDMVINSHPLCQLSYWGMGRAGNLEGGRCLVKGFQARPGAAPGDRVPRRRAARRRSAWWGLPARRRHRVRGGRRSSLGSGAGAGRGRGMLAAGPSSAAQAGATAARRGGVARAVGSGPTAPLYSTGP